jgi:hypothetical protein
MTAVSFGSTCTTRRLSRMSRYSRRLLAVVLVVTWSLVVALAFGRRQDQQASTSNTSMPPHPHQSLLLSQRQATRIGIEPSVDANNLIADDDNGPVAVTVSSVSTRSTTAHAPNPIINDDDEVYVDETLKWKPSSSHQSRPFLSYLKASNFEDDSNHRTFLPHHNRKQQEEETRLENINNDNVQQDTNTHNDNNNPDDFDNDELHARAVTGTRTSRSTSTGSYEKEERSSDMMPHQVVVNDGEYEHTYDYDFNDQRLEASTSIAQEDPYRSYNSATSSDDDDADADADRRQGVSSLFRPRRRNVVHHGETIYATSSTKDKNNDIDNDNNIGNNNNIVPPLKEASKLVYRYFGKSTTGAARSRVKDHIPFIVLSPRVDYWKQAGTILSSKGFSVIACETTSPSSSATSSSSKKLKQKGGSDSNELNGHDTVQTMLDALRWKRAVIVGNDSGGVQALQAALQLGPDRVAGLVLCGDLRAVNEYVKSLVRESNKNTNMNLNTYQSFLVPDSSSTSYVSTATGRPALDEFLEKYLKCPSMIVWDGDLHTLPNFQKGQDYNNHQLHHRHIILGGGSSPHRRLPEQFSWVLSRFVEETIVIAANSATSTLLKQTTTAAGTGTITSVAHLNNKDPALVKRRRARFLWLRRFWSSQHRHHRQELISITVTGRIVAAIIVFVTAANVFSFQYYNMGQCIKIIHSHVRSISSLLCDWSFLAGALRSKKSQIKSRIRDGGIDITTQLHLTRRQLKRRRKRQQHQQQQQQHEEKEEVDNHTTGEKETLATLPSSEKKEENTPTPEPVEENTQEPIITPPLSPSPSTLPPSTKPWRAPPFDYWRFSTVIV